MPVSLEQASRPGLLRRLAAIFYDAWLILALWLVGAAVDAAIRSALGGHPGEGTHWLLQLYLLAAPIAFYCGFWTHGGQTLGMRAWRLRVVGPDGGRIGLRQALLRCLAALLSCDVDNTDKVVKYINECKQMGIAVLPPDINESFADFTVINDRIRFGLAAVKNVGGAALVSIIEEREKNDAYKSLGDFCSRIDSARVNRKVIESLIKAGALDSMGGRRTQYMEILDQALDQAKAVQRDRLSGQMNLFALTGQADQETTGNALELPDIEDWPELQRLAYEKETVGFFLTGHPLESVIDDINRLIDTNIDKLDSWQDGQAVRLGGLIQQVKEHKSRKGDRMAFTVLEDMTSSVEVIVFPSTFADCSHLLGGEEPLIVLGTVQQGERGAKIIAQSIDRLADALEKYTEATRIRLQASKTSRQHMEQLKEMFYTFHGKVPVQLTLHFDGRGEVDIEILKDLAIRPDPDFFQSITGLCGPGALQVQMKKTEVKKRKGHGYEKYNRKTEH
ncbi:MAG: RDD family protein [Desulfobulbaceae bacterium]|nr:RDD family protein [Desulfobulbaceae bacterium]